MSGAAVTKPAGPVDWLARICAFLIPVLCILWNLDVPPRIGIAILTEQFLAAELGLAICLLFLTSGFGGRDREPGPVNIALGLLGLATLGYAAFAFPDLLKQIAFRPDSLTIIGTVVVALVLEGVRRGSGWTIFIIVSIFILYALMAHLVPGPLIGRNMGYVQLVQYIGFDPSAVFSTPLTVGAVIVVLFVFFGQLLFLAGGGEFFTDIALALTGRSRGGSAKISVVASALFGSISGSAVSNVVTTGVITIPLMRRGGYSRNDAGAIEAIASTGGQLTPPIMGAAAFLMAEFLDISYFTVAAAALVPALLYYLSVFVQVDLIAARDNIRVVEQDVPQIREVLIGGWHLVIPFIVLIGALFWLKVDPETSALYSAAAIIIVGAIRPYRGSRITIPGLFEVCTETGRAMVNLLLIVAAAGFIIGILNVTGLGFALTLMLVDSVGNNLVLILIISALISIILGMGLPTSGVYVLLAALVAPAIVETGVEPIAAHMFILYFGMMSMITPPIALAAFAASAISKADAMSTGFAAMRIGWASYIIPFVFVCTPTLLLEGSVPDIAIDIVKMALGIAATSTAIVGFLTRPLSVPIRGLVMVLGLACMPIGVAGPVWAQVNMAASLLVIVFFAFEFIIGRRQAPLAATPETKNSQGDI